MTLDGRLSSLNRKVDQLMELMKEKEAGEKSEKKTEEEKVAEFYNQAIPTPQAEIRSLELWRAMVAECLGTLCYVFFVCGITIPWTGHFPPFLSIAFTSALAYGALTYKVFPGSHLNPAFTAALASVKCISPLRAILFLTAQAGGGIAGAAVLFG